MYLQHIDNIISDNMTFRRLVKPDFNRKTTLIFTEFKKTTENDNDIT